MSDSVFTGDNVLIFKLLNCFSLPVGPFMSFQDRIFVIVSESAGCTWIRAQLAYMPRFCADHLLIFIVCMYMHFSF